MMVPVVFLDIEIDRSVADIGVAGIEDGLDGLDLLDDVARGARLDGRRCDIQQTHGLVVAEGVGFNDFHRLQLFQAGFLRDLVLAFVRIVLQVADVRDVADIADLVAQVAQQALQHVIGHARTGMAEVGVAVNGRAADIHAGVTGMDRNEKLLLVSQGIGKKQVSHIRRVVHPANIRKNGYICT